MLIVISEFEGISAGAMWEDLKMGLQHGRDWKRIALVTDVEWMRHMAAWFGWLTPGEMRQFPLADRAAAVDLGRGLTGAARSAHRSAGAYLPISECTAAWWLAAASAVTMYPARTLARSAACTAAT